VWQQPLDKLLARSECGAAPAYRNCYLTLQLTTKGETTRVSPRAHIFPVPLKSAPLSVPKLRLDHFAAGELAPVEVQQADIDAEEQSEAASSAPLLSATLTVSSDVGAAYVVLDTPLGGHFSDNSFHMDAGSERSLTFVAAQDPLQPFTLEQLQQSVRVRAMTN